MHIMLSAKGIGYSVICYFNNLKKIQYKLGKFDLKRQGFRLFRIIKTLIIRLLRGSLVTEAVF